MADVIFPRETARHTALYRHRCSMAASCLFTLWENKRGCKKTSFLHPFMVYFDVKLAARRICNHLQLGQLPDSSSGEPQFTQKRGFCSSVGVAGVVVTGVATGAAAGAAAALF